MSVLVWLGKNISSLLLAFALALVVWVSSVTSSDPNQEQMYPRLIIVEVIGPDPGLLVMEQSPTQVRVTLNAPRSRWTQLLAQEQPIRALIDLTGLEAGEHIVPVQVRVNPNLNPVRVIQRDPPEIHVSLEPLVTRNIPVILVIEGEPMMGYQVGEPEYSPEEVIARGPASLMAQVSEVRAYLDITGSSQSIDTALQLVALDESGEPIPLQTADVNGITLTPDTITITQPINLLGGYRNVIVKPVYSGQVAEGYKLTNITVSPPNVVIFSSDLQLLNEIPGYIETVPLDLGGEEDDVEAFLEFNLQPGIEVPNNQRVLVQVSIAAIESNLTLTLPVEVVGLQRGLAAQVAPSTVDVIFSGPLPVLNTLKPSDIRVSADLTGKEVGVHQIVPNITFLPDRVNIESILPASLEVSIMIAPTPTITPSVTTTPAVTPTSTQNP